ncbi:cupin domain-containing protein [Cyanobium sp. WAJ14-Wanaka]|uniref:cupin domain-containing protein n=1 Tax=Cyanobium sp. WAJ14-Wanaka TaxID=2823725 RepID=UPI0020CC500F|nr:cupin domain-containing protein [Cyanobium sp. WAJ14-Wanaka]MCP9775863.1 cupin domain-containing protein [Cyanobium sp. WAJ14-Wanaka]
MNAALPPAQLIELLQLQPHREGGHYRETYRAKELVTTPRGPRPASTAILFLLTAGERSHWHRIASDELWHHHGGGGLVIHELCQAGKVLSTHLGLDLSAGQTPQHGVPAGSWFAAEPMAGSPWSLVSCTVAPGFDFADFELASQAQLASHASALGRGCPHWQSLCAELP